MVRIKFYNKISNFGDDLNRYILQHFFNLPLEVVTDNYDEKPHLIFIGSMIQAATTSKSVLWGTGMMAQSSHIVRRPLQIACVRGPLTRDCLIGQGVLSKDTEITLGDPALLLSSLLPGTRKASPVYDIGFVPHYADKMAFQDLCSGTIRRGWNRIQGRIDPQFRLNVEADITYGNIRATVIDVQDECPHAIERIGQCAFIVSSSLHGLIVADALGIPNAWIRISDNLYGGSFKFIDYMRSVGRWDVEPIRPRGRIDKEFIKKVLDRGTEWSFNFDTVSYRNDFDRFLKSEHFRVCA